MEANAQNANALTAEAQRRGGPLRNAFCIFFALLCSLAPSRSGHLALLFSLLMVSCNHVYKEYDRNSFSATYVWDDGQEVKFNPEIDDASKTYLVTLALRHHFAVAISELNIHVKIVSPSGKETAKDYKLMLKDSADKNIGSCAGDMCDLETIVFEDLKFEETGEYQVTVTHTERGYRIPGILEVGLIIDEKSGS